MKAKELPPVEWLREHLDYNPVTGDITIKKRWHKRHAVIVGKKLGTLTHGYLRTEIYEGSFFIHRLAYAIYHGVAPEDGDIVDHINGNPLDNRIENLRLTSHSGNSFNRQLTVKNTSGHRGVSYRKDTGRWVAYVSVGQKRVHLGSYDYKEDAITARLNAEQEHNIFVR
jgi:hypothetical protein